MAKSLETHFSDTLGQLTVQNTLLRAQIEQLTEQAEALLKERDALKAKYEPASTEAAEPVKPELSVVKD